MRKILTLLLILTVIISTALPVAANAPQKVDSLHPQFAQQLSVMELDGESLALADLEQLAVTPGAQLRIYLLGEGSDPHLFFDQNDLPVPTADVSVSRLRAGQIGVEATVGDSEQVVDSLTFGYSPKTQLLSSAAPYIDIRFIDRTSSTEDLDFDFTLALTQDGQPLEETALRIAGAMYTTQMEVTASDTAIDIADGRVALALEDVSGIEISLGEDITVVTDMVAGEKYYGVAWLEQEEDGEDRTAGETVVRRIYALDTINLDSGDVRIHSNTTLHVYDENGTYLGTTRDLLPCRPRYSLANKRVEQLIP